MRKRQKEVTIASIVLILLISVLAAACKRNEEGKKEASEQVEHQIVQRKD